MVYHWHLVQWMANGSPFGVSVKPTKPTSPRGNILGRRRDVADGPIRRERGDESHRAQPLPSNWGVRACGREGMGRRWPLSMSLRGRSIVWGPPSQGLGLIRALAVGAVGVVGNGCNRSLDVQVDHWLCCRTWTSMQHGHWRARLIYALPDLPRDLPPVNLRGRIEDSHDSVAYHT